jgi:hypothetical protein
MDLSFDILYNSIENMTLNDLDYKSISIILKKLGANSDKASLFSCSILKKFRDAVPTWLIELLFEFNYHNDDNKNYYPSELIRIIIQFFTRKLTDYEKKIILKYTNWTYFERNIKNL